MTLLSKGVGRMDRRITFRRRIKAPDSSGGVGAYSWTTLKEDWAQVQDADWTRSVQGGGESSVSMRTFTFRYDARLNTRDFCIEYNGYRYIPFVSKDLRERNRYTQWTCRGSYLSETA